MRGFTLVEVIIVVGIIAIIGITVIPNFFRTAALKDLSGASDRVVAVLRDASARSLTADSGKVWGVQFDANNKKYIMSTYVASAFEAPVTFVSLKNNLEFRDPASGLKQVVFSSLTGEPNPKIPVTIIIGLTNEPANYKTITVYANGRIEVQ